MFVERKPQRADFIGLACHSNTFKYSAGLAGPVGKRTDRYERLWSILSHESEIVEKAV